MSLQTFEWDESSRLGPAPGDPLGPTGGSRTYYRAFTLQETRYQIGDSVYLHPERDGMLPHLGKLQAAFTDNSPGAVDVLCIEVRWYERVANLEPPSSSGPMADRELVELEDADVNPMGCLAGKANVFRVNSYEEAEHLARRGVEGEWFFCRGFFKQSTGEFMQWQAVPEDGADSDDVRVSAMDPHGRKRQKMQHQSGPLAANMAVAAPIKDYVDQQQADAAPKKVFDKGPGKQCVECGATQTPQWREGPAGPKTLCNACGVRYNRLRASKKNGTFPRQSKAKAKQAKEAAAPAAQASQAEGASQAALRQEQQRQRQQQAAHLRQQAQQQQQAAAPAGRPQRHAALLAANRTAAFARTGMFPEEDGDLSLSPGGHPDSGALLADAADGLHLPGTNGSMEPPMHIGDAGSRKGKQGGRGGALSLDVMAAGHVPASSPMVTARTFTAASSLMAMSHNSDSAPGALAAAPATDAQGQQVLPAPSMPVMVPAAPAPAAAGVMPPQQQAVCAGSVLRGAAMRAVSYCPDVVDEFGDVFANFEALQDRLPQEVVQQLSEVTEQVDKATKDAAAAEAALQAVLQVVAQRQKEADATREQAAAAVERLKGCMTDVMSNYGSLPAAPSSPAVGVPSSGPTVSGGQLFDGSQPFAGSQALMPGSGGGSKALLDSRAPWGNMDHEHVSLVDSNLFGGAADSGAALFNVDAFGSALIKVRN